MRLGKYQLLRKLATGGMAEVFLAKTDGPMGFEKQLVIKRILPHLAEDPQFVQMFLAEAKLAARLNHPNLVQLFDFGQAEGSYFIAMEYIDGPTLRLILARARDLQTPISLALAARIVSSAAEGLAYAHDFRDPVTGELLQLIHRDVSPDNILISRSGAVKLVDFGIAKAQGQSHHTQAGTVKGKVAYMAPEQLRGEALDRRVDLYALGVVLYELCTGRMPYEATSDATMVRAVLYEAPIPAVRHAPNLPWPLQAILERLLAKNREARYPDCLTLHADLESFIQSTGETTNGFALSRLVAKLTPPAMPVAQPAPPPVRAAAAGTTPSAFAQTSPVLLSEPIAGSGGALPPPPEEILALDRTVRSEPRRPVAPPAPALELKPADARARTPAPSAFVFPTSLEKERGAVTPVTLGLDRPERRARTSRTDLQAIQRGGGVFRALGLLVLFLVLAAVGATLGLAAAHRTDLLARLGIPLPGFLAPPGAPSAGVATPGGSPAATTPGAPAGSPTAATPGAPAGSPAPAAAARGAPAGAPAPVAAAPGAAGTAPAPATTSAASGTGTAAPTAVAPPSTTVAAVPAAAPTPAGGAAAPAETATSAPAGAAPAAPAGEPSSAGAAGTAPAAASAASTESPAAPGEPAAPRAGEVAAAGAVREQSPPSSAAPSEPGTTPPSSVAATPPARSASRTQTTESTRRTAPRESDKQKLLGAFAELESAKDSTVRLESTPRLQVRMGGKLIGTTPVTLTVPASATPVELEFFNTGLGLSRTEQLTLKPGDNGTHSVVFPRGKLELRVQDGVTVSVDGKPAGTAPLAPISLYAGQHVVQLTKGGQKERRTLDIQGDQTEVLEYMFPDAP